jgi:ribosomal protein S27E
VREGKKRKIMFVLKIPKITTLAEIEENLGKAQTQKNNTSKNLNSIKDRIQACYHCTNNKIIYDEHHDELYCRKCGHVLKQALHDYKKLYQ